MNASKITAVTSYPVSAKVLHWASALMIISMLFLGVSMIQTLAPWQYAALALHQSFGVLVLVLVVIRLLNKLRIKVPELPSDLSKIQVFAAKGSHVLLYLGMLSLPILGWLMQNANGVNVNVFGYLMLPTLITPSIEYYGLLRELHGLIAWLLFGLILLHITGALYHGFIRRDDVLKSMALGTSRIK
jgi:cytochrome b561